MHLFSSDPKSNSLNNKQQNMKHLFSNLYQVTKIKVGAPCDHLKQIKKHYMKRILGIALLFICFQGFSQEEEVEEKNNLQVFTPSVLLNKGQWDIKFFNGLYTQTRQTGANNSNGVDIPRQTFLAKF